MYIILIFLPLLGSIVSGFFGRKVGVGGVQLITSLSVIICTILAVLGLVEVGFNKISVFIHLKRWIDCEILINWAFQFDTLTIAMLMPVLIISSLVHLYSVNYMSSDPNNKRFFSYLSLFTFMMIILVTADNYLLMFVGWEGVGVCSYLLVSFWYTRMAANLSSMSAFFTNRVGDCFVTIGIIIVACSLGGNLDYATVFSLTPYINENAITTIGICLLIGGMSKSAQFGLHVWLPYAMEGPTPVSALIHAATMVTAGVYLFIRSSPLIEYSSTVLLLCLWLGGITTVFSSLVGLFQQDIKKVIAYSTMSQLGMMVVAIGLSSYYVALFHLINHAFYKALLFLGGGSVIHVLSNNQDLRKYGGLIHYLPLTYSVILIGSLSLVAFPFMTGFYSKDWILESAYGEYAYTGTSIYYVATFGAVLTTLYSVKVLYLTFLSNPKCSRKYYGGYLIGKGNNTFSDLSFFVNLYEINFEMFMMTWIYTVLRNEKYTVWVGDRYREVNDYNLSLLNDHKIIQNLEHSLFNIYSVKIIYDLSAIKVVPALADEGNIYTTLPLVILAICSILFGFIAKDIFISVGPFVDNSLFIHPNHEIGIDTEVAVSTSFKLLPLFFTISITIIALVLSEFFPETLISWKLSILGYNVYGFFNQRFWIEWFYNKYIITLILNIGGVSYTIMDKGGIELLGPYGLEIFINFFLNLVIKLTFKQNSSGVMMSFIVYLFLGFFLFLLLSFWSLF